MWKKQTTPHGTDMQPVPTHLAGRVALGSMGIAALLVATSR
jgi:hypothetical protein